jgi:hypothetical protein
VAVVTGQQAGAFGGPLYTLLKAITALRLAARVRQEYEVPAVAVFWIDSEDHDWDEVASCAVFDADAEARTIDFGPAGAGNFPSDGCCSKRHAAALISPRRRCCPPVHRVMLRGSLHAARTSAVKRSDWLIEFTLRSPASSIRRGSWLRRPTTCSSAVSSLPPAERPGSR